MQINNARSKIVGDMVFLKVAPMKGVMRFGKKGKLSYRFERLFEILKRVSTLTYRLSLPLVLFGMYNVFHVSMLSKYVHDFLYVVSYKSL